jgi:hypothetical protein
VESLWLCTSFGRLCASVVDVFVHHADSAAGITSGSPSSVARLQKSITARTAWLWATMDTFLWVRCASFADLQKIELKFVACRQGIEQMRFLIKSVINGEIFSKRKSLASWHDGDPWNSAIRDFSGAADLVALLRRPAMASANDQFDRVE